MGKLGDLYGFAPEVRTYYFGGCEFRLHADGMVSVKVGRSQRVTIDPSSWASMVACMSHLGENGETYAQALAFHAAPTEAGRGN